MKVTGDPNVPFDKITFEIETPGCLNIPKEEQASCRSLERFLEEPQYLDFQEGLTLDFKMPEDIWENHGINVSSCQGRWSCRCQVAGHGYSQPSFIPGNLVKFSEDSFGVIFLQINSFSIYKRLEEPI